MKNIIVTLVVFILVHTWFNSFSITDRNERRNYTIVSLQDTTIGKGLIAKSDCMVCHKENKKLIGPSFLDIANKYKTDKKYIDYLSSKIIKGGKGVWGQIPMNAHPSISKEDADEMINYILSIKQ